MSTSNRFDTGFRQSKKSHFSSADKVGNCSGYVFNGYKWINPVLIKQIDVIRFQPS
jgi:hypothetical protein